MDKLYMIVPAYNEEENIDNLINDWYPIIEKINKQSRLVIINDGSTDNTLKKLKKIKKNKPLLKVLDKKNGGHGDTLIFGYKYAIKKKADFIFQTDSDGQTNPKEFEQFWIKRNHYDAIIGNRTNRQDGNSRKFVEKVLCLILRTIFKVKLKDANAPFRLMKTSKVKEYLKIMPGHYNLPNVILTTCFKYYNDKLLFIPISFKPRQAGINSINIKKICKIGLQALNDFKKINTNMKEKKRCKNI